MIVQAGKKRRAATGAPTAAKNDVTIQPYHRPSAMSSASFQPPNGTLVALGSLLIYLCRDLPQTERRIGWRLVERWARQLVESRIARTTGAA